MRLAGLTSSLLFLILSGCTGPGSLPPPGNTGGGGGGDDTAGGPDAGGGGQPIDNRVTTGLQAIYRFDEGSGTLVHDESGIGLPLDLTIADPGAVSWLPDGGLSIDSPTIVKALKQPTKLGSACQGSNEISIEAWVQPAGINQSGPARIVTFSIDNNTRNFTLGQDNTILDVRLRTSDTDPNGEPATRSDISAFNGPTVHLVYTRSGIDDQASVWVDGQIAGSGTVSGDFSNWDMTYGFALGNELNEERPWRGDIYLAAVYCHKLSAAEVWQNYQAGY